MLNAYFHTSVFSKDETFIETLAQFSCFFIGWRILKILTGEVEKYQIIIITDLYFNFLGQNFANESRILTGISSEKQLISSITKIKDLSNKNPFVQKMCLLGLGGLWHFLLAATKLARFYNQIKQFCVE